jgi:hypothetical protein
MNVKFCGALFVCPDGFEYVVSGARETGKAAMEEQHQVVFAPVTISDHRSHFHLVHKFVNGQKSSHNMHDSCGDLIKIVPSNACCNMPE